MRFLLYCGKSARDVGIENQDGSWDYERFREHIGSCPACGRFTVIFSRNQLDNLAELFQREKGSQVNNCPQSLYPPAKGEKETL